MQFEKLEDLTSGHSYVEAKIALITSMTFLGVNYGLILLLWFFMLSDTILGVAKAVTLLGWSGVSRGRFLSGIGTKLLVLFVPLSLAVTGALVGYDLNIFVNTALYALIANDAASCYTNLLSIKTKKNHVNKDVIEMLINSLRALIYKNVKKAIENIGDSDFCEDEDTEPIRPTRKRPNAKMDQKPNA